MSETLDLSPRSFKLHAAQQLASSPSLRNAILRQLYGNLSHRTMTTLNGANLRFGYAPGCEPFLMIGYEGAATILHPQYWQELDELCWEVTFVTGIYTLQIVGEGQGSICWLNANNHWVRQALL